MKKQFILGAAVLLAAGTIWMSSCKKEDTTPPTVSIKGSDNMTLSLNAALPADPGATANDDKDGDISAKVSSDWSTAIKKDLAGTYKVTYTASDAAGNTGTVTRTVYVANDAAAWAGTYSKTNILDSVFADALHTSFVQIYSWSGNVVVTASTTTNNKLIFDRFSDYSNYSSSQMIYGTVSGTSITVPSQTANGIGPAPGSDHTFQGSGSNVDNAVGNYKFKINSSDLDIASSTTAYDAVHFK
ncbi:MAG: DUF5011 domain-containing protein [Bacteroidetes bacterium]|nr:DUF5011 domain-containing protein [Bacteroidota bacterium]